MTVAVDGRGARLVCVDAAPGWDAVVHRPRGWFTRRRPQPYVAVALRGQAGNGARTWEFELEHRDDGVWAAAVLEGWHGRAGAPVDTPAGRVQTAMEDGALRLVEVDAHPGWSAQIEAHDGDTVVVVLTRGDEEWEVQIVLGDDEDVVDVERDHRWHLQPPLTG